MIKLIMVYAVALVLASLVLQGCGMVDGLSFSIPGVRVTPQYGFVSGNGLGCHALTDDEKTYYNSVIDGDPKKSQYGLVHTACGPAMLLNGGLYTDVNDQCQCWDVKYSNLR